MKTLAEQIGNKCKHYNGLMGRGMVNDSATRCCNAGVVYLTVMSKNPGGFERYPCFREGESVPCEKRQFRTEEEVAAVVADRKASLDRLLLGMGACSDDAKKQGFKKGSGGNGFVLCPVCKTGDLHYSVSGYNGHMHGRCSTKDCISWMQ